LNAQDLQERKKSLQANFKPGFLDRSLTIYQFLFDKEPAFYLSVTRNDFEFLEGRHEAPTLTLSIKDHASCWGLLEGHIDGMEAFMSGIYRADGNIVLSQLILYLFKSNDPTNIYEVQD